MSALKETTEAAEPGKEHAEICPGSPKNVVKMLEHQEPETPRRSASLGPTSQEENHEKQEQPSPVSILDPFFHEDDDSQVSCAKMSRVPTGTTKMMDQTQRRSSGRTRMSG